MASMNRVFLMGNLTRDPELKYTPQGSAVANFSIAVNRQYKGQDGEMKKEVQFFNIVVWNKAADNCAKFLKKGSPALIEGRLSTRSWEKDGKKHSTTEIIAENVQFLGNRPADGGAPADHPRPEQQEPDPYQGAGGGDEGTVPF